jgi:nifR3 family TIM-barrel protein
MRDLDHAERLIAAVCGAVSVPVTLKTRLGWDEHSLNAPELARRAEANGLALVTIHGRTRQQFYKGRADWWAIRAVRAAISLPLLVNGDIGSPAEAEQALAQSGADGVMIGRAALGRPWLVGEIAAGLDGRPAPVVRPETKAEAAISHVLALVSSMGASHGLRHARKHIAAYLDEAGRQGAEFSAEDRLALLQCDDVDRVSAGIRLLLGQSRLSWSEAA